MKRAEHKIQADAKAKLLQEDLNRSFPDLTASSNGPQVYVRGTFPVIHEGKILDRYQIEIVWTESDTEAPVLSETGGRIPWTADRHMSQGGKACLFVPEEWLIRPREQRTLVHYLEGPVRNYFLWQSLFERGVAPPWGERSHGVPGLLESYSDLLGFRDVAAIKRCLLYLSREKLKGHWACPCGANRRLRDCHMEHLRELRAKVPRHVAQLALKRLRNPTIK